MPDPGRLDSPKFGLWCNWIFVLLTAVGWPGIAHFYLPARADLGLDATKAWSSRRITGAVMATSHAGAHTPSAEPPGSPGDS